MVPKGGLEPPCPQGAPDFENLKSSISHFFKFPIILIKCCNIMALKDDHVQIQSHSVTFSFKPTGTKRAQPKRGYAGEF